MCETLEDGCDDIPSTGEVSGGWISILQQVDLPIFTLIEDFVAETDDDLPILRCLVLVGRFSCEHGVSASAVAGRVCTHRRSRRMDSGAP